jgi:type IV pilus assembly protein PilE
MKSAITAARRSCEKHRASHGARGFTLIELLITLVIIAILATIALPSYTAYITRSKVRTAQNDLVSLALNMENYYQQQLTYPPSNTTTAATQTSLPGWAPAQGSNFTYQIQASTASSYTLKATGSGTMLSGYVLTLDSGNTRQQTAPDGTVTTW